jgi:hypothetical protein
MCQLVALCDRISAGAELGEADRRAVLAALDELDELRRERAAIWAAVGEARTALNRLEAVVAGSEPAANDDSPPPATTDPTEWYLAYIERERAAGHQPSREQDHAALLATGFQIDRETARALRRCHAPPEWREPGRPRSAEK